MQTKLRWLGKLPVGRGAALLLAVLLSGCIASTRNPERLFAVPAEMDLVRSSQDGLIRQYWDLLSTNPAVAQAIRNDIITQRMYAIDVQYTQYETALTQEVQEIGFAALTTAGGLSTAATLVASSGAKTILSALATGVLATKGYYESQILLTLTMRTIQKQMRASRNIVATSIAAKMAQNVTDYPLWSALSDVEDYYTAGTLTTGVIDTSTTVGIQENLTRREKQDVQRMTLSARRSAVLNTSTAPIANPATFVGLRGGRVLNPNGRNEFEKNGLTPAMISKMERVVCLQPRTGTLTDALRTAVLQRLGIELTPDAAITNARATRITSLADSSCP